MPLRFWHALGAFGGWLVYRSDKRYAAKIKHNLTQSKIAPDDAAYQALLRQTAKEIGKGGAEILPIWLRPYRQVLKLVQECQGWEHVEAAAREGKGILAMTPHLGCFEIVSLYYAARRPMTVMYRPPRQHWIEGIMRAGRARGQISLATTDVKGVRALLTALKKGEAVGILPDQVASKGEGVWADFFGRAAYTPTLVARLHQSTGAVPLLMFGERLPKGQGYRIHIEPLPADLSGDKQQAASALNAALEQLIRQYPAQYLWSYNRYKRPGGVEPPAEQS
ncbi:lysophospholipid acyltransferase family protein [Sulfuriferula sp. AH1]|uniref:lysophospholipid acyltransferase family protein n=1 Tax=Sulfuriferula sp. AH1 TaxID=1985873 RepID=UPI00350F575A